LLIERGERALAGFNGNQHVGGATVAPPTTEQLAEQMQMGLRITPTTNKKAPVLPGALTSSSGYSFSVESTTDTLQLSKRLLLLRESTLLSLTNP
jgi:hypothetical protein